MSFRGRLLLIAGTAALAFILVIGIGVVTSGQVADQLARIDAVYVPKLQLGPQLRADLEHLQTGLRDAASAQDREALEATRALKDRMLARVEENKELLGLPAGESLDAILEEYYRSAREVSSRLIDGETGEAIVEAMAEMQEAHHRADIAVEEATAFDRTQLTRALSRLEETSRDADEIRLSIALLCSVLVLTLTLWISRSVVRSIQDLSAGFARFGEGRFDTPIAVTSTDELGQIAISANRMAEKLRHLDHQRDEAEQRLLKANEELRHQTDELESFSYSVSHDLRAPLRAIDGFVRILVEDHSASLDEEGRRVAEVIRSNAQKMGRLIDDLLAFSRLGRQPMRSGRVDMTALAKAAFAEAAALEQGRTIDLRIGELPAAIGDATVLKQVWSNLMSNAVKYTRRQPQAVVEVTGTTDEDEAIFCVRDNGVGFDMKYADKLFAVFQRLHSGREFEGTGVGLALVGRIIKRHGGRVWAEGKLNEGATFFFALPRRKDGTESA